MFYGKISEQPAKETITDLIINNAWAIAGTETNTRKLFRKGETKKGQADKRRKTKALEREPKIKPAELIPVYTSLFKDLMKSQKEAEQMPRNIHMEDLLY